MKCQRLFSIKSRKKYDPFVVYCPESGKGEMWNMYGGNLQTLKRQKKKKKNVDVAIAVHYYRYYYY